MIRKTAISVLLATSFALPAAAASPLPPGRPAGSKKALLTEKQTIFIGVGLLTAGLGIYLAAGEYKLQGGDSPTAPVTPPVVTPSTTP